MCKKNIVWKTPMFVHQPIAALPKASNERQEYFLNKAAQQAHKSNMRHRHGTVIVDCQTDEIISTGFNHTYIHMYHGYSCHSEVDALRKIKRNVDLSNMEMYVVRIGTENMGHPLKLSTPCDGCTKAILKANIGKVYYSWSDTPTNPNNKNYKDMNKNI
jgi:deoxycytidylate deaminase